MLVVYGLRQTNDLWVVSEVVQSIAVPFENPVTRVLRKFAYSA